MRILILGAGRAGRSIAQALLREDNDITVVDINAKAIEELQRKLDLRAVVGDAASPETLVDAGIEDADLLLALTTKDEINLVACLLAAKLFNVPSRIARIHKKSFAAFPHVLGDDGFCATQILLPEVTLLNTLRSLIAYPEALQVFDFVDDNTLITLKLTKKSFAVNTSLAALNKKIASIPFAPIAIYRNKSFIAFDRQTLLVENDEVTVLLNKNNIEAFIKAFGPLQPKIKNIVLGGNASLSLKLASVLNENDARFNIKIIDEAERFDDVLSQATPKNTLLVTGYVTNEETLLSNSIDTCDTYIALSRDDKTNVLSSLLAKTLGAKRAIAVVDDKTIGQLVEKPCVDVTLSSTQTLLDELLLHVRQGDIVATHHLRHGKAEVLDIVAHGSAKNSRVIGKALSRLALPSGVRVVGLLRPQNEILTLIDALPETVIEAEDHLILFVSNREHIEEIEALFAVDIHFF